MKLTEVLDVLLRLEREGYGDMSVSFQEESGKTTEITDIVVGLKQIKMME